MIPVICNVKNDPPHSYGDCVRACVASIMHMESENVPHFYNDGDGDASFDRMRIWLSQHGKIPAYYPLPRDYTLQDVLREVVDAYGSVEFMLFCQSRDGDHCVIGQNGEIIHDPAWYRTAIIGPHSSGVWIVIILAKVM